MMKMRTTVLASAFLAAASVLFGCRQEDHRTFTVELPGLAALSSNPAAFARAKEEVTEAFATYTKVDDSSSPMTGVDMDALAWDGTTLSFSFNALETAEMNLLHLLDEIRLVTNLEATVEVKDLPMQWSRGNARERELYRTAKSLVNELVASAAADGVAPARCLWWDDRPIAAVPQGLQNATFTLQCASRLPFKRTLARPIGIKTETETLRFKLAVAQETIRGDEIALRPALPALTPGAPAGYINTRK